MTAYPLPCHLMLLRSNKLGYWPNWLFHNLLETVLTYPNRRYGLI